MSVLTGLQVCAETRYGTIVCKIINTAFKKHMKSQDTVVCVCLGERQREREGEGEGRR